VLAKHRWLSSVTWLQYT